MISSSMRGALTYENHMMTSLTFNRTLAHGLIIERHVGVTNASNRYDPIRSSANGAVINPIYDHLVRCDYLRR